MSPVAPVTLTAAVRAGAPFDESVRVGTKHHKWRRLSAAGWRGHHLPLPLFSYRLHATNISGIGRRLLPELTRSQESEWHLARIWPTANV